MSKLIKAAAVVSAILLVGGFIAYRSGAVHQLWTVSGPTASDVEPVGDEVPTTASEPDEGEPGYIRWINSHNPGLLVPEEPTIMGGSKTPTRPAIGSAKVTGNVVTGNLTRSK
jgi:hypothetical protein